MTIEASRTAPHRRTERFPRATWALEVWAAWFVSQEERGWPAYSSEVAAAHRQQTATAVQGIARYCGVVELATDANGRVKTVPREAPPMPKETRPSAGSRIPKIDPAKLGPQVSRHLWDLFQIDPDASRAVQARAILAQRPIGEVATQMGFKPRRFQALVTLGLAFVEARLSWTPPAA